MTVRRLSACSVKVQLSADELNVFLPESVRTADSPQMLRLLSFMLAKAEAACGIPFSSLPVTVELLTAEDGGLAAYFTAQMPEKQSVRQPTPAKTVRLAARFAEQEPLRQCCTLLRDETEAIQTSMLYQYQKQWVLFLKLKREKASAIHHILAEHGRPYRLSVLNRARLTEYGTCIFEQDAVQKLLRKKFSC